MGQLSYTCLAISAAESFGEYRNSFVLPLTKIKRKLIISAGTELDISAAVGGARPGDIGCHNVPVKSKGGAGRSSGARGCCAHRPAGTCGFRIPGCGHYTHTGGGKAGGGGRRRLWDTRLCDTRSLPPSYRDKVSLRRLRGARREGRQEGAAGKRHYTQFSLPPSNGTKGSRRDLLTVTVTSEPHKCVTPLSAAPDRSKTAGQRLNGNALAGPPLRLVGSPAPLSRVTCSRRSDQQFLLPVIS